MVGKDKRFEQAGTEPHGQAAEFVDAAPNQPGDHDDPAPPAGAKTSVGGDEGDGDNKPEREATR